MKFLELKQKLNNSPIFTFTDILKFFPETNENTLKLLLSQWASKGYLKRIKKGLYCFSDFDLPNTFYLCQFLYSPSYISLESALNFYGIIPDIPQSITCVTNRSTRCYQTPFGSFLFRSIKELAFFGFETITESKYKFSYQIALPEKALLDFLYFNLARFEKAIDLKEERFLFEKNFNFDKTEELAQYFGSKKLLKVLSFLKNAVKY